MSRSREEPLYTAAEIRQGKHFYVHPGHRTRHEKKQAEQGVYPACTRCGGEWADTERHLEPASGFE